MNNMKFGECLKCILKVLNISMSRLAKSIHVDSSLVNRWVHGERIPPYKSSYIENIAEYLSKNIYNEIQIKNINDILIRQGLNLENLNTMHDKIKAALMEAQGYSFHFKSKSAETDSNENILQKKELNEIVELSCNDKVVFGFHNIDKLAIDLLKDAENADFAENKVIYMTFNNNLGKSKDEIIKIRNYFSKVISKGWKVIILMRIDNNVSRILRFTKFVVPLLIQGGLTIYYYTKYGIFDSERETFVIPEVGAISSFRNSHNSEINTAFFLKSSSAIDVYEEYFKVLIKNDARRLMKYYSRNESMEYCNFFVECEESVGNRMVFKSNLSTIMLPEHVYKNLLKKSDLSEQIKKLAFVNFKRQCNSFKENVKNYECKEIYLMDSIDNLIKYQEFYLYYYSGIIKIKLDVQDIIELLENIIHNLKTYINYNISFINKKSEEFIGLYNFSFVLKDRKALFYENYNLEDNYPTVRISIEEPFFIHAYSEFYKKNWDGIASLFKEKQDIIIFLIRQIQVLKAYKKTR